MRAVSRNSISNLRNLLLGFRYGGLPSINSLESIYNFQDKPWVYAHLRDIQLKLGGEKFPLIEQEYYPDHREMVGISLFMYYHHTDRSRAGVNL